MDGEGIANSRRPDSQNDDDDFGRHLETLSINRTLAPNGLCLVRIEHCGLRGSGRPTTLSARSVTEAGVYP